VTFRGGGFGMKVTGNLAGKKKWEPQRRNGGSWPHVKKEEVNQMVGVAAAKTLERKVQGA